MSIRIFKDVEEALAREVRRITFHDGRTVDEVVLEEAFDPFTGEIVEKVIEPDFYDSGVNSRHVRYPHFFVKLKNTREDRFSNRIVPTYGQLCEEVVENKPKAYEIVVGGSDGLIGAVGNDLTTSIFNIRKVLSGHLIRLLSGNNQGTYFVDSVTPMAGGSHVITVSSEIVASLPAGNFNSTTRVLTFFEDVDLNTVLAGDDFVDSLAASFSITSVDAANRTITLGGASTPDTSAGGKITRPGDVFQNTDTTAIKFIVMDPAKPVFTGGTQSSTTIKRFNPQIPIDAYYLIRIDSTEQEVHTEILNRMWEEFNPPRTGLPTIIRTKDSAEELLTEDIPSGGSTSVKVADNSEFNINDTIFIIDDLTPTKDTSGGGEFQEPFQSRIIDKISTDELVLANTVPDTFTITNCSKIVSNAEFFIHMFHFVDHITRDVEGSQYWIHEFTFWVQVWVDRLEAASFEGVVQDIETEVEQLP